MSAFGVFCCPEQSDTLRRADLPIKCRKSFGKLAENFFGSDETKNELQVRGSRQQQ
jgi:hypothetical protein